jgi:hypothetical protein
MPAPLAPQHGVNPSYPGPYGTAQRGRQPQSDYRMPRGASLNAASNPASNSYPRSSQVMPNSTERSVRINDTPSHTVLISLPLFTRRTERQSNVRMQCPASNFLIQVLLMTHQGDVPFLRCQHRLRLSTAWIPHMPTDLIARHSGADNLNLTIRCPAMPARTLPQILPPTRTLPHILPPT